MKTQKKVYDIKLKTLSRDGWFTGSITLKSGFDLGVTGEWELGDIDFGEHYFEVCVGDIQLVLSDEKLSKVMGDNRFDIDDLASQIESTVHSSGYLDDLQQGMADRYSDSYEDR